MSPTKKRVLVIALVVAFSSVAGMTGVLAFIQSKKNEVRITEVQRALAARIDLFVEVTKEAAKTEGVLQEKVDHAAELKAKQKATPSRSRRPLPLYKRLWRTLTG